MKFLSHGIGELVLKELRKASEARLAVAFFNPDNRMLDALAGLPKLKLIVSEEFAFTNPYKLEKLKLDLLRSVSPDDVQSPRRLPDLKTSPNASGSPIREASNMSHSAA